MRVITTSNIDFNFAEIESALKKAHFISFDTQYSGVVPEYESKTKPPSFATPSELYSHICRHIKKLILLQFGLTTFTYNSSDDKYTAHCYTFFVYPRSVASMKKEFVFNTSATTFLAKAGFDFNKCIYKGVNYLSSVEEAALLAELRSGALLPTGDSGLSQEEEAEIQMQCAKISEWEVAAKEGQELELEDVDYNNKLFVYLLNKEVRRRYHTMWTHKGAYDTIVVTKVTDLNRTAHESKEVTEAAGEKDLMRHYLGLSRVFKLMVELKRPVIGSGPLVDLMLMFQELYKPLPASYRQFKEDLHVIFPHIYDVKHVSHVVQDTCRRDRVDVAASGLEVLMQYYQPGKGASLPAWKPAIELSRLTNEAGETVAQDAGWDSYYTGVCFTRMAHFLAQHNNVDYQRTLVSEMFAAGVKRLKNHIHIAPATVNYMVVDGPDPAPDQAQSVLLSLRSLRPAHTVERAILPEVRGTLRTAWLGPMLVRVSVPSSKAAIAVFRRSVLGDFDVDEVEEPDCKQMAKKVSAVLGLSGFCMLLSAQLIRSVMLKQSVFKIL